MLGYLRWRKWANNFSKKCWIESITQGLVNVLDIGDFEHLKYLLVIFGDEKNPAVGCSSRTITNPCHSPVVFPRLSGSQTDNQTQPTLVTCLRMLIGIKLSPTKPSSRYRNIHFQDLSRTKFCRNQANSDGSSYSFFCRRNLSCEGLLPPLSIQPSLACSLPLLARGCLPTLIKPRFPSPSIPTQISLHWNTDKLEHCISKKCNPRRYNWTHIWTNVISEEPPIFRFRGYPSFSVGKGSCNLNGSGLVF
jgi:hypothetical protein